jgi:hypothetical protein
MFENNSAYLFVLVAEFVLVVLGAAMLSAGFLSQAANNVANAAIHKTFFIFLLRFPISKTLPFGSASNNKENYRILLRGKVLFVTRQKSRDVVLHKVNLAVNLLRFVRGQAAYVRIAMEADIDALK